jgi:hypothetical protein
VSLPNLSLNPDAPRRACGPPFVAPVTFVRWAFVPLKLRFQE